MINKILSLRDNAQVVAQETISIEESVQASLENISELNPKYNAIIWRDDNFVESQISLLKRSLKTSKNDGLDSNEVLKKFPLLGVPITVKELDSPIRDTPNSWGNKVIKEVGYKDNMTADTVNLIQNAGAVVVGKTNNPEFGIPIITYSQAHGVCLNPLDVTRNAGGSSGGAAACVASGMTRTSLGGDGGGSIRIPASNCGLWGFKPSKGKISGGPIADKAWSGLATKGPISLTFDDLIDTFNVLTMSTENYRESAYLPLPKLKIGIRREGLGNVYPVDDAVNESLQNVIDFLIANGHEVEDIYPTLFDDFSIISSQGDIIAHHINEDFQEAIRRSNGTLTIDDCDPSTQYFMDVYEKNTEENFNDAIAHMNKISQEMDSFLSEYDILLTPTCADVAPTLDFSEADNNGLAAFIYAGLTLTQNMAGVPALSVPVKTNHKSGLPVGIQIIAKRGKDDLALQLGQVLNSDYSDIYITNPENITN